MRQFFPSRLTRPLATSALWALAFASAAFWGLRLSAPPAGAPYAPPAAPLPATPDSAALARLLGALPEPDAPGAPPEAGRFSLIGVLAGRTSAGAALIAVDGQPAKPFRVGSQVVPGYVLKSVGPRRIVLGAENAPAGGDSGGGLTIEMPASRQ
ncbi:type II secretion system protein N [Xylophilus sp. GOD-11R]|uniref:type II secretion system protein N n=1 Tax=Xylophilus sp. GOD-11R TaxID=3089814 RepID=UPI00298CE757|nr:type II secretion system protein N [Xylophilus sp. GOD-11R]WPB57500.1 type II secretion system protein N [Xylophilus sp. GOD-11R]